MDSSYFLEQERLRYMDQAKQAQQAQQFAGRNHGPMGGFAAQESQRAADNAAFNANMTAGFIPQKEAALSRNREMGLAEREQELKYAQMANETGQKYGAQRQAMGALGGMGAAPAMGGTQTPAHNVSLFANNGQRIGGSLLRQSLLG